MTFARSYRDYLSQRGLSPLSIERTPKAPGDLVLTTWARPADRVGTGGMLHDRRGRFVGRAA